MTLGTITPTSVHTRCGHRMERITTFQTADPAPHFTVHVKATCEKCLARTEAWWERGVLQKVLWDDEVNA